MSDDFYSFYGSGQKTEESKPEAEVKKPSGVQTRKLAPVTVAPSSSVPTPTVPDRPLAEPDPRQIDQATLAQQAQTGLTKAGPPQAPSVVNAMSDTGKDLLPYAIGAGGAYGLSKLFDMFNKKGGDGGPPPPPGGPTHQDEINRLKLEREQLKNEKAKIEHQNWLAKNTLTEAEQIFGRKAKDATELRLMEKAYEQQKSGVVGATPPPPVSPAPVAPASAPAATPAASVAPTAPPVAPPAAPAPQPAVVQPANVISTGPTPEAVAAPIEKAAEVKEVTTPKKAKTEPKIPKPEFFKNAPSAERWMYGSMTKYMDQPASAQAVVARAADYLPEGTKFEMQPGGEGGGIHPEQKQHLNRFVSEQLGVPLKDGKLPEDFKFTTENRNKLAASVQSELETHAKAGTLGKLGKGALAAAAILGITEAVQAAQKGDFGPLREAGFNIGGPITASAVGLTALSKAAGVPFSLATYSGGLNENEQKELAYRRKVGAGRGIAPPSDYMR